MRRRRLFRGIGAASVAGLAGCPILPEPDPPQEGSNDDEGDDSDGSDAAEGEATRAAAPVWATGDFAGEEVTVQRSRAETVTAADESLDGSGSLRVADGTVQLSPTITETDGSTLFDVSLTLAPGADGFLLGFTRELTVEGSDISIDGGVAIDVDSAGSAEAILTTSAGDRRAYEFQSSAATADWVGVRIDLNDLGPGPSLNVRLWDASRPESEAWDFRLVNASNPPDSLDTAELALWAGTEVKG